MENYPFIYTVEFYADYDSKMRRESGITFASTFTQAMESIEDYYGDSICAIVSMNALEASNLVVIPTEMVDTLIRGEF